MKFHALRRLTLFASALLLLCTLIFSSLGEAQIKIFADDWSWEPGAINFLNGSVTPDRDLTGAKLSLTVETRLEDSGSIVFSHLNGKRLKTKKKLPDQEINLTAGVEVPFEAEWTLPDDTGSGLGWAAIHLRIMSADGAEIASGLLEMGSQSADEAAVNSSLSHLAVQARTYLLIFAAAIWVISVLRAVLLRNKRKKG